MKFLFSQNWIVFSKPDKSTVSGHVPRYFVFTEIEIMSLAICLLFDIIEYGAVVLTLPLIGDLFDIIGIVFCLLFFRWIGFVSFLELLPGADVFPIFIITWLIWYFLKKRLPSQRKVP
jgi:hypothetical protein